MGIFNQSNTTTILGLILIHLNILGLNLEILELFFLFFWLLSLLLHNLPFLIYNNSCIHSFSTIKVIILIQLFDWFFVIVKILTLLAFNMYWGIARVFNELFEILLLLLILYVDDFSLIFRFKFRRMI